MLIKPAGPVFRKFDFPPLGIGVNAAAGVTNLTPSATLNTKGAYSQLIASTAAVTRSILIQCSAAVVQVTPGKQWLIDIALGGAGSEVNLIPNLVFGVPTQYSNSGFCMLLPMTIAAGTRISARCQTNINSATDTAPIKITTFSQGFGGNGVDAIGVSTATSEGTALTPASGSKSSYVQLTASAARAYKGMFALFDCQGAAGGNYTTDQIDFATGAAASEVVFLPDFMLNDSSGSFAPYGNCTGYLPFSIPAASRIAVRGQGSGTANAIGVSVYGVY
jgi:hypothetical protein